MPLSSALPGLTTQIQAAYNKAKNDASNQSVSEDISDSIIQNLSNDLGDAIHNYMLQALVTTNDVINPGQPVIPIPTVTASPGVGNGTGNLV